jgi:hypothetical protein
MKFFWQPQSDQYNRNSRKGKNRGRGGRAEMAAQVSK